MARDDDDAVSEEPQPQRRKNGDDDDEDRPRKKRSHDDDDDDDESSPRKKSARAEDEDDSSAKKSKPMPLRLVMAIIASMAWGGLMLHASCVLSSHSVLGIIQLHRQERDLRDIGFLANQAFGIGKGFAYTVAAEHFFMMLMAALLLAGGFTLLMRKGIGKFLAMGAPAAMVLVELITFIICLIITSGSFLTTYNAGFLVNIVFSAAIAGCNTFMLLNKDVSKALK